MKILTFKLDYADKRWNEYLKDMLGEETAESCHIESGTTKDMQFAVINILNFDGNTKTIKSVKSDKNVKSAYIVENNNIKKVLI